MNRTMKESRIEWLGEVPDNWRLKRAKGIFVQRTSKGNQNPVLLSSTQKQGMMPQHLLEGVVQTSADTDLQLFKTVHINDYVISLRSFQGGFEKSNYEGVCSPAYQVFYNRENIDYNYYWLLFKCVGFISKINSLTVGIREGKNIQYKDFANMYLPFPPVPEQQAIADFLDKKCGEIDELIALQEKIIEELKAYKQSVITEAVTKGLNPDVPLKDSGIEWIGKIPQKWELRRIKFIGTAENGLTYSPSDVCDEGQGILVLRSSNIQNGRLCFDDNVYVLSSPEDLRVHKGDIIICSRNGSAALVGKSAIVEEEINACFGAFMMRFRSNHYSRYTYYLLTAAITQYRQLFSTTTINQLTIGVFANLHMPFIGDKSEQIVLANYLDSKCEEIDALITIKQSKIEELKEYKKSIIYEYVTGKKQVSYGE